MNYTNTFNGHQGDVQFFSIDVLPSNAKKQPKTFFAKSEKSGHCHALCGDYDLYTLEDDSFVIDVKSTAILNHTHMINLNEEYWDTIEIKSIADHKPTIFTKGIYRVGIQRRKKPFSKIWEKVID